VDELVARFKRESGLVFTLDTLEYLARGGRIGRAAGWAGQLMNIKPILTLAEGEVLPLKRVRGNRKAIQAFADTFEAATRDEPGLRVGIAHAEAPERLAALTKLVRAVRPQAEIEVATTLGPVLGTHAGPGTVGLFWFQDSIS
jgi:DegV family protein with EDD domain